MASVFAFRVIIRDSRRGLLPRQLLRAKMTDVSMSVPEQMKGKESGEENDQDPVVCKPTHGGGLVGRRTVGGPGRHEGL